MANEKIDNILWEIKSSILDLILNIEKENETFICFQCLETLKVLYTVIELIDILEDERL